MSEKEIENEIKAWLDRQLYTWYFKVHGGPMQLPGVPDIVGCYRGKFFAIEIKVPGKQPTPIQYRRIKEIGAAKGITGYVTSLKQFKQLLKGARP